LRAILHIVLGCCSIGFGETGEEAWLRYAHLPVQQALAYQTLPATTVALGNSDVLATAQKELVRGLRGMLGRTLRISSTLPEESVILVGTLEQLRKIGAGFDPRQELTGDAYWLSSAQFHGRDAILIVGSTDRGALYGTLGFLCNIARAES